MKLQFAKQADAQAYADKLHHWMLANNTYYAASVTAGHTKQWAIPYQQKDENGNVIDPMWCVGVKDRCMNALTVDERKAVT